MDAPDELRQVVAVAIFGADYDWTVEEAVWAAKEQNEAWARDMADAVLAVPAIADALERDRKVAEIVSKPMGLALDRAIDLGRIAALYPETGAQVAAMLRDGKG